MDWEFVQAALEGKVLLREQMPKLLQDERTTTFVTPCIRKELEQLMKQNKFYLGAYQIITRRFEGGHEQKYLSCKHEGQLSATECIKQHVGAGAPFRCCSRLQTSVWSSGNGNPDKLCVGAQNYELRKWLRTQPGVPMYACCLMPRCMPPQL